MAKTTEARPSHTELKALVAEAFKELARPVAGETREAESFTTEVGDVFGATLERLLVPVAELEMLKRKEYLTEREVGLLFSISPASLRSDRSRGQGPGYIKDGRRVLYSKSELTAYFDSRLVKRRNRSN